MKVKIFKNKNFISDITLNIIASGLMATTLQFIVYPLLNKETSAEIFGEILFMMSIVNITAVLLGNSLNNVRLIFEKEYQESNIKGDFLSILVIAGAINFFVITIVALLFWNNKPIVGNLLLIIVSILTMLRAYLTVEYRLKLNYKKIFQHSLIYSFSFSLSTLLLIITDLWQIVFFSGELISFIFLVRTTSLLKEPFKITIKFKKTIKQYFLLSTSSLIGNVLNYLDRLIIFPFLGPHKVAVFFTATLVGKLSSFIVSPISGVLLSYISNKKGRMTLSLFWKINIGILIFSSITTIFTSFFYLINKLHNFNFFTIFWNSIHFSPSSNNFPLWKVTAN